MDGVSDVPSVRITNGSELCQLLWAGVGVALSAAVSGRAGSAVWLESTLSRMLSLLGTRRASDLWLCSVFL